MDGTPNTVRHSSTTADDLEQKIFISTRFTAKDVELRSRDSSGQASVQYSNNGKHLDDTIDNRFKITVSVASLPTFPKILLKAL